jgi:hypothetical protein
VFYPNSNLRLAKVTDGTSNTLMAAEVKAWTHYNRNAGPGSTAIPNTVAEAAAAVESGNDKKNTGHTEWPDGRVHHTGFTATMPPNTYVPMDFNGTEVDADYNSWQEGRNGINGNPTYAMITARSTHSNLVQAAMVDGSVQSYNDDIAQLVWRALATRNGGEIVSDSQP